MVSTLDKKFTNEHGKYNEFDKYKSKAILEKDKPTLVADISQADIDATKMKGFKKYNLKTLKELGIVNPSLSEAELETLKKSKDVEPTGKFKNE
tara:strand:- start:46 stop:327 length:282 start_codon:yes stop_codon:yes gene_type:complete